MQMSEEAVEACGLNFTVSPARGHVVALNLSSLVTSGSLHLPSFALFF